MTVYAAGVDLYFQDPHLGRDAVYRLGGTGGPQAVRVVERRPDAEVTYGSARLVVDTAVFDIRVSEVTAPVAGDTITFDGATYAVQGEPVRDDDRLVWTIETRPA